MTRADLEPELLEIALIGIAHRAKYYKIAAYGTARAHAQQLGIKMILEVLGETLEEEKQADHCLTMLAENKVNVQASMSKIGVRRIEPSDFPTTG